MAPTATKLPADVLRVAFDLLAQPDVLASAAVSRAWRECAILNVNYYRACSYLFPHDGFWGDQRRRAHDTDIENLAETIDDAGADQYRLSLTLGARTPEPYFPDSDSEYGNFAFEAEFGYAPHAEPSVEDAVAWLRTDVAPVVRRAVPLLVRLDLFSEPALAPVLLNALTVPAPHLRSLWICVSGAGEPELPLDLFSGSSPLLREARVTGTAPLNSPYLCFANVRKLALSLGPTAVRMDVIAAAFSAVKSLTIHSNNFGMAAAPPLESGALKGFSHLESLSIRGRTKLSDITPAVLSVNPSIRDLAFEYIDDPSVLVTLLTTPPPQRLELHEYAAEPERGTDGTRSSSHARHRMRFTTLGTSRELDGTTARHEIFRFLELSGAADPLTAVAIDDRLVRGLLKSCFALPALEQLDIVLLVWYNAGESTLDGLSTVSCPRLKTIALHPARAGATINENLLAALVCALCPARPPHIVLNNGLALAKCARQERERVFASVQRPLSQFYPSAHAARVTGLLEAGYIDRLDFDA